MKFEQIELVLVHNRSLSFIKLFFLMIIIFFFPNPGLLAQEIEGNITTEQIWLDYNPLFSISDKFDIYGDIAARTVFPNEWYRFVIGPSLRYKYLKLIFKKLYYKEELHFGIRFFFTVNKRFHNRLEIRPFQGYRLVWPNRPKISIQHYVRLEERFDMETSNWISTFGLRLRYMIELKLKLKRDLNSFTDGLYFPVSMEFFWNLKGVQQFNDVIRITPGVGYEFSKIWKAEFDLSYHYTRNTIKDNFATNDIVFRFRVFHTLN